MKTKNGFPEKVTSRSMKWTMRGKGVSGKRNSILKGCGQHYARPV